MHLLLVEDDERLARALTRLLEEDRPAFHSSSASTRSRSTSGSGVRYGR